MENKIPGTVNFKKLLNSMKIETIKLVLKMSSLQLFLIKIIFANMYKKELK